jgi:valyl-tRNA synthetase
MNNKYNFFDIQNKISQFWEAQKIYETQNSLDKNNNFIIDTPPPTVSGNLHIGHIFSYTHQDIIARYKRMQGFNVIYPFGFDDNGLPTERYVEKKRNIIANQYSRNQFTKICAEEIEEVHKKFIYLWQKLGLSCDWNLTYSTISKSTQYISQKYFIDLYNKGYIYKKNEPALYCTAFRTSISQADLEDIEKQTTMNTIIFKNAFDLSNILIATTRPELLAGCVAVLVNPHDDRFNHLIGKKAIVPIYEQIVPIIGDELVIPQKGTGIVMSATFGDALDVSWFKKYNFEYKKVINFDGTLSDITLFLQGMKVELARAKILEKLSSEGLLIKQEKINHRVSVYERSKKEIEYVMLNQWFVSILPFKEKFLELADQLKWYPAHMKFRYIDWVKNLSWDWCISRQRSFGIPFPIWYDNTGKIIVADLKNNQAPIDPMVDLPHGYTHDSCIPDSDVMDTWNTSSLTPYIIKDLLEKKNISVTIPFSIRPQSHDIIRTWAFDTIVKSYFLEEQLPWQNIVISGHVLAGDKEKISKSKENSSLDPENLLKQYPSDVVRYWTASTKLGTDTLFSENQLKDGNRLIIKLFNAALCIKNFSIFDYKTVLNFNTINEKANRFILQELSKISLEYHSYFESFDYNGALKTIEKFFWFFCDQYLEIVKVYQHKSNLFTLSEIKETQKISGYIFLEILKKFSPFLPFICEHLFSEYYILNEENISIHKLLFNTNAINLVENNFHLIITTIELIRKAKSEEKISLKTQINTLTINTNNKLLFDYLEINEAIKNIIMNIANAFDVKYIYQTNSIESQHSVWSNNNLDEISDLTLFI